MDFVIAGIAEQEGIESFRMPLDETFEAKNNFAHERNYGSRGPRFRYRQATGLVYWYNAASEETKRRVSDHVLKKTGKRPIGQVLAAHPSKHWLHAHGVKLD